MAIIDLGKVSITWRGTYAGGTAYTPKDAVVYNNASYICIANTTGNLPTDTTYWNVMAAKGVDGTNVGTTITTQGDILYRDGSGLQRLAAGTNGQLLKTGGAGANPSWTDAPSGVVKKIEEYTNNTRAGLNASSSKVNMFSGTFTTTTASSKILIQILIPSWGTEAGSINMGISWNGTDYDGRHHYSYSASNDTYMQIGQGIFDNSSTPGSHAWAVYYNSNAASSKPHAVVNPNNSDDGRIVQDVTSIVFTEFKN